MWWKNAKLYLIIAVVLIVCSPQGAHIGAPSFLPRTVQCAVARRCGQIIVLLIVVSACGGLSCARGSSPSPPPPAVTPSLQHDTAYSLQCAQAERATCQPEDPRLLRFRFAHAALCAGWHLCHMPHGHSRRSCRVSTSGRRQTHWKNTLNRRAEGCCDSSRLEFCQSPKPKAQLNLGSTPGARSAW